LWARQIEEVFDVASWLTGPHQENRQPQNSLIHVTSIWRA